MGNRVRSRLRWYQLSGIAGLVFLITAWEWNEIILFLEAPRLSAELKKMTDRCDSVVVYIHAPYNLPSGRMYEYAVLDGGKQDVFLNRVILETAPALMRDLASGYFVHLYLCDAAGKQYCTVCVQPAIGMRGDTQLKSIISAAEAGRRLENSPFDEGFVPCGTTLSRKCYK